MTLILRVLLIAHFVISLNALYLNPRNIKVVYSVYYSAICMCVMLLYMYYSAMCMCVMLLYTVKDFNIAGAKYSAFRQCHYSGVLIIAHWSFPINH